MKKVLQVSLLCVAVLALDLGASQAQACLFAGRPLLRAGRFVARVVMVPVRGVQAVGQGVAARVEARAERPVQSWCPSGRCGR
jgi:hypothetical protein